MVWMIESWQSDDQHWEPISFTYTRRAAKEQVADWKSYDTDWNDVIKVKYRIVKYAPMQENP